MILILTNSDDPTADLVVERLARLGAEHYRFDTNRFPIEVSGTASFGGERPLFRFRDCETGRVVDVSSTASIWYRRPRRPNISEEIEDAGVRRFAMEEAADFLRGVWYSSDAFWVSDPNAIRKAEHKLVQLANAKRFGFQLPRTCVTSDPQDATAFCASCARGAIAKPVYMGFVEGTEPRYIYTSRIGPEDLEAIETVRFAPVIFQELVAKVADIRVTVVGSQVFAARIDTPKPAHEQPDWRAFHVDELQHSPFELPDNVRLACLEMVRSFGLSFGAIDLGLTADGALTFFEINPNGQFAWLDQAAGLAITDSLVSLLVHPPDSARV